MTAATDWQWIESASLYYSQTTKTWAKSHSDGTWEYSSTQQPNNDHEPPIASTSTATSHSTPFEVPLDQTWPSEEDEDPLPPIKAPLLRLVVVRSSLLSPNSVALVDPDDGISIGRDKSYEKKIRLKELEVSKCHCVVFWLRGEQIEAVEMQDKAEGKWMITDLGSVQGTFLQRKKEGDNRITKVRLSEMRKASEPVELLPFE